MCQCTPTPNTGKTPPINIPSAWYDLGGRISSARAVAGCVLEALPARQDSLADLNHAANLVCAMQDLLDLAEADVNRLETQLKHPQGA